VRALSRSLREREGRGRLTRLEFAASKAGPVRGPCSVAEINAKRANATVGHPVPWEAEPASDCCRLPVRLRLACRVLVQKMPDDDENLLRELPALVAARTRIDGVDVEETAKTRALVQQERIAKSGRCID
jgi:hypothetical protein